MPAISLLTLNLNGYGESCGTWPERAERIAALLLEEKPDIAAFQAVQQDLLKGNGVNQAEQLARRTGYNYLYYHPATFGPSANLPKTRNEGSAFLLKQPPLAMFAREMSPDADCEDQVTRIALRLDIRMQDCRLTIFNCHFSWIERQNTANLEQVLPFLMAAEGRALVVGDFNAQPDSLMLHELKARGWVDAWDLADRGDGATFPSTNPDLRIDYLLVSPDLAPGLTEIALIGSNGTAASGQHLSDHLALRAALKIE